jgi:hypothetical protein
MYSPSVLGAKVLVDEPHNQFYLDVRPDELKYPDGEGDLKAPPPGQGSGV